MPRGRPPKPGTAEEKAAARREKVRLNVRALRERRKQATSVQVSEPEPSKLVWVKEHTPTTATTKSASPDKEDEGESQKSQSSQKQLITISKKDDLPFPLPKSVDSIDQYAFALLGMFRSQFLPEAIHLPSIHRRPSAKILPNDDFVWTPCAFWVTSAFSKASYQTSGNLRNTLLAIGVALNGVKHQDEAMTAASLEMYRKSLRGIRGSLDQVSRSSAVVNIDKSGLYLTCHAAAMFELIQNSNLGATMQHIVGLGQLMLHLGEGEDENKGTIPSLLLQDYRTLEMPFCLKYRYEPKLSQKRRQSRLLPTTMDAEFGYATLEALHNSNMMTAITDTADDVCLIMVRLDKLKQQPPEKKVFTEVQVLLERLTLILTAFDLWTSQLQARYGPIEVRDSDTEAVLKPLKFTSFELGSAYMFSLIIRAYGVETCIEAVTFLKSWELSYCSSMKTTPLQIEALNSVPASHEHNHDSENLRQKLRHFRNKLRSIAALLTRSIFYFFDDDKGIIGQTMGLFPLEIAKEMLSKERQRLQDDIEYGGLHPSNSEDCEVANMLQLHISEVERCLDYCGQMQIRAHNFGLPSVFDN